MTGLVGVDINPKDVLPKDCPTWCTSTPAGHFAAFHEIGDPDPTDASLHMSGDIGHQLSTLVQSYTGETFRVGGGYWSVEVRAQGNHAWFGPQFVRLELGVKDHKREVDLDLTSAEVRTLARQLLHMADKIDLEP